MYTVRPKATIDTALQTGYATNEAVVITLPAASGQWVLHGVSWGYNATPTNGRLTVAGGGINYSWPVITGGPGFIPLPPGGGGELSDMDTDVVITLAAGGTSVRGDLNVHAELLP
jgi:hypothetical protein